MGKNTNSDVQQPLSYILTAGFVSTLLLTQIASANEIGDEDAPYHVAAKFGTTPTANHNYVFAQQESVMFSRLAEQWREERGITSSISDMIVCPSYLKIIGMGQNALPLILEQIKREGDDPDHWFTALEAITGEDPVSKDAYGDTVKMAAAWLSWADEFNAQ